jgi:sulfide:quinone oxidoreductase
MERFDVLIVGGGTAGITTAAQLRRHGIRDIAIIEPSSTHYYQPLWTLVGAGVRTIEQSAKLMSDVMPKDVRWIQDSVVKFDPDHQALSCQSGKKFGYQWLVVCPGMEILWDKIKGLRDALGKNGVTSNYSAQYAPRTWDFFQAFTGGTALFTFPNSPVKCAGAPQKILYLFEDYVRRKGLRQNSRIVFASANKAIFGVKKYADALNKIIHDRGIETMFRNHLIEVKGAERIAVFENLDTQQQTEIKFDFMHVTPPMSAPAFIRESPLSNQEGWIDVDQFNMRHKSFKNIFGLGDASSLPTSRTGAAIRKQVPVMVQHILAARRGITSTAKYDGYSSCPLVTGYGRLILAEFDYDGKPAETFPFDQSKERLSMYLLKKYTLPLMYWYGMLKGRA